MRKFCSGKSHISMTQQLENAKGVYMGIENSIFLSGPLFIWKRSLSLMSWSVLEVEAKFQ